VDPKRLSFIDQTGFLQRIVLFVDMVNIDAEGRDGEVLQMIDLDQHRVSVVVIENFGTDDHDAIERHLVSHGFTRRPGTELDTHAYR
jgi:hypothetical protein